MGNKVVKISEKELHDIVSNALKGNSDKKGSIQYKKVVLLSDEEIELLIDILMEIEADNDKEAHLLTDIDHALRINAQSVEEYDAQVIKNQIK